ncbi:O-antigen/teichoic acid export membrane protein [Saccharothrix tamanrassetensis]|uniref:O-antigen/teichoic acid export membrane protein n=1 Tax=Saccharothrix tamanrassetensis TaxID=1051531 RepID=A0A841CS57_9PSEU|nr:hypothetical protein [Saccharothrix tamanrassetensis]MBB5958867.1 O-antigen/teichoic acid export membrane protein [Saccharothrix tamanrassetensis]
MSAAPVAGRSLGTVGIATLVAAGLGYPLLIVTARVLSPADAEVFLTFWGLVFGAGSAMAPIEQEVSRQAALADVAGRRTGFGAVQVVAVCAVGVVLLGLVVMLPPVGSRLFGSGGAIAAVAAAGAIGFAFQFGLRGLLMGHHRVKPYSGLVVAEALVRAVLLGGFVLAGLNGLVPLTVAVAAGSFAWLVFAWRGRSLLDLRSGREPWGVIARRMFVLVLSAGLTASVLTGYPAIVKLFKAPTDGDTLSALFLTLTVARLPLLLLSPVQAMAVPAVVRLSADADGRRRLRALLAKGAAVAVGVAAVGAALGALLGPWAVRLIFGSKYSVGSWAVAGLVWSSIVLGAVMLLAAVLVARKQGNAVLLLWALVAALSVLVLWLSPGEITVRAVLGLVVAPTAGLAVGAWLVLRERAGGVVEPSR